MEAVAGVPVASPRIQRNPQSRRKRKVHKGTPEDYPDLGITQVLQNFERKVYPPYKDLDALNAQLIDDYLWHSKRVLWEDLPTAIPPVRVHRDLKAANILCGLAENFRLALPPYSFVKLADFGQARRVIESEPYWSSSSGLGTTKCIAPEVQKETFTTASDVYSYGMTCYEILTGKSPFSDTLQFVPLDALGGMGMSYPCKPLCNKEQRKFLNRLCDQEWSDDGQSKDDISTFTNGECGMEDIPVTLVPLGSIQLDGTNEHRSQANYVIEVKIDTKLKGEPAQAIMGWGGMGKSTLSDEVKRTFLKKRDEDFIITKNGESAIINGECGIEAMEEQTGIVQMDAELPSSADLGELLCDESDSETEEFDIPSDDDGWSGESAASGESQAEVTSDSHVPQTKPSQNAGSKRSAASAFGEDDLITRIGSFVNKQIEVALQPLMCALRSRDEDEQKHREKMLAFQKEKLVLIRQKMLFSRILAQSNAIRARLPQIHPQNCPIPDLNTEMPVPHVDVKGEGMAKSAHGNALLESDINRLKLNLEDPPPRMIPTFKNHEHPCTIESGDSEELKWRLAGGRTMHSLYIEFAWQMKNLRLNEKFGMWAHKYRTFGETSPWMSCYPLRSPCRGRVLETDASNWITIAMTCYYADPRVYSDYKSLDELLYPDGHHFQEVRKKAEVQAEAIKEKEAEKGKGGGGVGGGGGGTKGDGLETKDGDKEGGEKKQGGKKPPEVVELKVPLCCDECARRVKKIFQRLDGVESVVCDLYERKVVVKTAADTNPETVLKQVQKVKKHAAMWPKKETEKESGDKKESGDTKKN